VQPIHGSGQFSIGGVWQYPNDFIGHTIELFGLLLAEAPEHVAGYLAAVTGVADTDAKALKVVGAEVRDGIPQTFVSAMSAASFKSGGSRGNIQFVVRDQNLWWFNLEEIGQGFNGQSAAIHKRGGVEQMQVKALPLNSGIEPVIFLFGAERLARFSGQRFDEKGAGVMAGIRIVRAWITQPNNHDNILSHSLSLLLMPE